LEHETEADAREGGGAGLSFGSHFGAQLGGEREVRIKRQESVSRLRRKMWRERERMGFEWHLKGSDAFYDTARAKIRNALFTSRTSKESETGKKKGTWKSHLLDKRRAERPSTLRRADGGIQLLL
jgi:hypothetical protein